MEDVIKAIEETQQALELLTSVAEAYKAAVEAVMNMEV